MLQLEFTDKMVPYDVFIKDLAREIVVRMNEASRRPSGIISQNQAFKYYGAGNVRRRVSKGMIVPLSKRPGKVEYRVSDLDKIQQKLQDYF